MPYDLNTLPLRRRGAEFEFYGDKIHVEFWQERITKDFRSDCLNLNRMTLRLRQRQEAFTASASKVEADPDSDEARVEEEKVQAAYQQLLADDNLLKARIDEAVYHVLAAWDVVRDGKPVPVTLEEIEPLDAEFLGAIIGAVIAETKPLGEANGRGTTSASPSSLRQKASLSTKKASSSRHR